MQVVDRSKGRGHTQKPAFNSRCPYHIRPCKCNQRNGQKRAVASRETRRGTRHDAVALPGYFPPDHGSSHSTWVSLREINAEDSNSGQGKAALGKLLFRHYSSPLTMFNSPSVNRAGLGRLWIESSFPYEDRTSPAVLAHIGNWLPVRSRAHEATTDALGLFELATTAKTRRVDIVKEAIQLVTFAAQNLRSSMQNPDADKLLLHMVAQELLLCDVYNVYAVDSQFWQHHIRGIIAMEAIQHSALASSSFGRVIIRATRLEQLLAGLYLRKALGAPTPCGSTAKLTLQSRHLERFLDIGLQLPSLLAAFDDSGTHSTQPFELLEKAMNIENDLKKWLIAYKSEMDIIASPFEVVPLEESDFGYRADTQERPFAQALRFQSVMHANYHTLFWISLLLVSECIEAILVRLKLLADAVESLPQASQNSMYTSLMSTQANECAVKLCQSIPYLYSLCEGSSSRAMAVSAPLHFAELRFSKTHPKRRKWCIESRRQLHEQDPFRNWEAAIILHFFGLLWFNFPG